MNCTRGIQVLHQTSSSWSLGHLTILALVVTLGACGGREDPLPTVPGPEAADLIKGMSGYIVIDRPRGGIVAVALPSLEEVVIRAPNEHEAIYALSGPDGDGRIVFVEILGSKRHRLRYVGMKDGDDRIIFEREGDPLWHRAVGTPAIAPEGGKVAFVWNRAPGFHTRCIGPVEIWSLSGSKVAELELDAIDSGISWFPDGDRLALVEWVRAKEASWTLEVPEGYAIEPDSSAFTPIVAIFDLRTNKRDRLLPGMQPVVWCDGESVALMDSESRWWHVDLHDQSASLLDWPGNWRGLIACTEPNLVLYWGLPTEGGQPEWRGGSPLVADHSLGTLKIAQLGTGRFQTVIRSMDPRRRVSFGVPSRGVADR